MAGRCRAGRDVASRASPAKASSVSSWDRSTCTGGAGELALPQRGQEGERAVQPADGVGEGQPVAHRAVAEYPVASANPANASSIGPYDECVAIGPVSP